MSGKRVSVVTTLPAGSTSMTVGVCRTPYFSARAIPSSVLMSTATCSIPLRSKYDETCLQGKQVGDVNLYNIWVINNE